MKWYAFVMYLVHDVLLNFTAVFRRQLVDIRHAMVGFLAVSDEDVLKDIESADQSGNFDSWSEKTAQRR